MENQPTNKLDKWIKETNDLKMCQMCGGIVVFGEKKDYEGDVCKDCAIKKVMVTKDYLAQKKMNS